MGHEADLGGYFEGSNFIRTEQQKFSVGEHVSYYGVARITKVEITKYRREPGSTIKVDRDGFYYHVVNIDTGATNQEFNSTLDKDRLAELLYG
jgi:hypothetical protein